ncbi:hypothetical protein BC936DRAFT_140734 [Jimgerdemannia flammicorona]|uniref:Transmembrane protein 135 N-terminal domain-containing protein n=1 Tax=Jimgerdemannia flammicorona TaxID=994334 RepID=A0A433DGP3_9FUNG|nr:hypothetical protein BC936DRAFT_140734 [Jimgerdemannia flammicorona]
MGRLIFSFLILIFNYIFPRTNRAREITASCCTRCSTLAITRSSNVSTFDRRAPLLRINTTNLTDPTFSTPSRPVKLLTRTGIASLKSGAFFATFVSLYQYQICAHRNLFKAGWVSSNPKLLYYFAGVVCAAVSIFIEDKKRRSELALYVLPKAMQSLYEIMYQRKLMFRMKHFEIGMCSVAMGIIMAFYQHEPDVLSPFVRKVMYQFFQKN